MSIVIHYWNGGQLRYRTHLPRGAAADEALEQLAIPTVSETRVYDGPLCLECFFK